MPEAVGICHGHRPSHGAEPQVGQRSLFDDTPNLLCVSELHVNRQRVIEGAILSFLDTAFASQASPDTCWNRQLSPSQQGVEGNAGNKRARSFLRKCLSVTPFGVDSTEGPPPLPRPCCRTTFLASTVGDGKS